ncbi:MAG TPA: diacylglycerol kinase family protein [Ktedonobacterales bacterium]
MTGGVRARLITNPRSGRGGVDLSDPLSILREHGWDVSVRQKLHGGHATELAREAAQEGCHVVVDCGGDGTLNELVEGVLGTETAVGVLPGGTANVWAHEIGVAPDLRLAAMQLVDAERRRMDAGQVTVNGKHKTHFILMAGVGIDGAIVERINKALKNRIGVAAVGLAALQALPAAQIVPVRVQMGDLRWAGRVSEVIVGNTRGYGSFTKVTADAFADDGMFDVCLMTATGALSAARTIGPLLFQRKPDPEVAQYYRAAHVTLQSPVVLPLQVDGGTVHLQDEAPTAEGVVYEFSLLAGAVTMLIPRTYSGELFRPAQLAEISATPPLTMNGKAASGKAGKARKTKKGKRGGHGKLGKRWRVKALEVGVDSLIAARVKNGRAMHIKVDANTTIDDGTGVARPLLSALSLVTPGEQLEVRGHKTGENHTVLATHIAIAAQNGHESNGSDKTSGDGA